MNTISIEKLVGGGQGLGHIDGKAVFVWNALPGETVEFEYLQNKKNYAEGVATKIITPSPLRQEPKEAAYLSTSPWQIMTFESEQEWKRNIAAEQYSKIGDMILSPKNIEIETNGAEYGYRNKMEFSFCEIDGNISLAFFERGKRIMIPVSGSLLAEPIINTVAAQILHWVQEKRIFIRSLKSLIIRSNGEGKAIAALFIKDKLKFDSFPSLHNDLLGFHLYYSTHKSPASVPTKILFTSGQNYLVANILETQLKFGLLSFFQINIPVFKKALQDIAAFLDPKISLVDFYSGVGSIGLPLSKNRGKCILIDNNSEAIEYANENIVSNNIIGAEAHCMFAEKMTEAIEEDKMIILDPPRSGLHQKVISELLLKKPKRILYLSCDIATQARDVRLLGQGYKVIFLKLYNFFPRTPHTEGLIVLDRID